MIQQAEIASSVPPTAILPASAIDQLRSKLASFTQTHLRAVTERCLHTRLAVIDQHLPWRGLPRHGLHELVGDLGAITGFLAALLGQDRKTQEVLWISPAQQQLQAHDLAQFGLAHDRLTLAHTRRPADRLWAFEDALRDLGYGAVVAEIDQADLAETRRLQQAAEKSGSIGFLIRRDHRQPSAALTRWCIEAATGDGLRPCWRVTLQRCRNGQPASWLVEWDMATRGFRLLATA